MSKIQNSENPRARGDGCATNLLPFVVRKGPSISRKSSEMFEIPPFGSLSSSIAFVRAPCARFCGLGCQAWLPITPKIKKKQKKSDPGLGPFCPRKTSGWHRQMIVKTIVSWKMGFSGLFHYTCSFFAQFWCRFWKDFGSLAAPWLEISMFGTSQTRFWHGRCCKNRFLMGNRF